MLTIIITQHGLTSALLEIKLDESTSDRVTLCKDEDINMIRVRGIVL